MAQLPVECVCKFRIVCKQWNALLSSTKFITQKWAEAPPNKMPWLVLGSHLESTKLVYCFFTGTWKETSRLSFSFVIDKYSGGGCWPLAAGVNCSGSAIGLFSLRIPFHNTGSSLWMSFTICNSLTRTSFELHPAIPFSSCILTGIVGVEADSPETYKVVMVTPQYTVEIYDSSKKSWTIAGHLPQGLRLMGVLGSLWSGHDVFSRQSLITDARMVFSQGSFYCLTVKPGRPSIMGFRMGEGTCFFQPLPRKFSSCPIKPNLFSFASRILLGAGIIKGTAVGVLEEVIIWEFEKVMVDGSSSSSSGWKEIARMPTYMCENARRRSFNLHGPYGCTVVGDCVRFAYNVRPGLVVQVIVYCLSKNTWARLPNSILGEERGRFCYDDPPSYTIITAFQPRPDINI